MPYSDPTASTVQHFEETEIRNNHGCEACESFGRAGECELHMISTASVACRQWELDEEWEN